MGPNTVRLSYMTASLSEFNADAIGLWKRSLESKASADGTGGRGSTLTDFGSPASGAENDGAQTGNDIEQPAVADFSIDSEAPFAPQPTPRRRNRWLTIGAPVGAAVLIIGGVAVAQIASKLSGTDTPGLASALPASTVAFAQANIDPKAGQKLAMYDIAHRFPEVKDKVSKSDPAGSLIDYLIKQDGTSTLTWDQIKQWAGVRVGAAFLVDDSKKGFGLVAIQVNDEAKAKSELPKLMQGAGAKASNGAFVIKDGYAYVTDTQAHLDLAMSALQRGTLADDATYKSSAKTVDDGDVASGYANLKALAPVAQSYVDQSGLFPTNLFGTGFSSASGSDTVMTSTGSNSISTGVPDAISGASTSSPLPGDMQQQLDQMQKQMADAQKQAEQSQKQMQTALDSLTGAVTFDVVLNGGGGQLNLDMYGQKQTTSAGTVSGFATLPSDSVVAVDAHLGDAYKKQLSALAPQMTGLLGSALAGTDIKLPADLSAVLGNDIAFSMTANKDGSPNFGGIVHGGNAERAKQIVDELNKQFGKGSPLPVTVEGSGSTFTIASSSSFGAELSKGDLGGQSLFRKAVPDAANSQIAAFVDVQGLLAADKASGNTGGSGDAALIAAVGLSAKTSADATHMQVNLVLK
jgi:hypothetical protein